jgi:hypothetical protein
MKDDLAYLAIVRLQRAYADLVTRRAWSEIAAISLPDARFSFDTRSGAVIEVVGAQAFAEFGEKMTGRFGFYEYIPLNSVAEIAADGSARGRLYSLEISEDRGTGEWARFYGIVHDDYALFEGAWRFARRQYQTLARGKLDRMESFPLQDRPF